jgi:hypothetical protein
MAERALAAQTRGIEITLETGAAVLALTVLAVAFVVPAAAFTIDDVVYIDMARAMAREGSLFLAGGDVPGAPLVARDLTVIVGDRVAPQYPSGYAFIAASFYAAFGMRGLILLNALAGLGAAALTWSLGLKLFRDRAIALSGAGILVGGTFFLNYLFAIWPHMLALLFLLGGVKLAAAALDPASLRRSLLIALSGAVLTAGAAIRVDAVLALGAVFLWLRIFAAPADRNAARLLLLGAAPVLLALSFLNQAKFGVFSPFTYGATGRHIEASDYALLLALAGAGFLAAFIVDVSRASAIIAAGRKHAILFGCLLALGVLALAPVRDYARGLYALLVDLQALPESRFQPGLARNAYGQISFWMLPKKALLQSLPFLPLLVVPIAAFFAGRRVKEVSLLLGLAAAPVAFYSLNAWHGGMSCNLRYFLPVLPFIALLAGLALVELWRRARLGRDAVLLSLGAGAATALLAAVAAERLGGPARLPLLLYPQIALGAALLIIAIRCVYLNTEQSARAALVAGLACIGAAGVIGASDEFGYERQRLARAILDRAHAAALESGDLAIVGSAPVYVRAEGKGALVVQLAEGSEADALALARAYVGSGRCVLANGTAAIRALAPLSPSPASVAGSPWAEPYAALGDCSARPAIRVGSAP